MLPKRYSLSNLKKAISNPNLFIQELRRIIPNPIYKTNNVVFRLKYGEGVDITSADWDNLIILDACRYDYFKQVNDISGELESAVSKGGHSWAFMRGNFVDRELHDTVYVTANPHVEKLSGDIFYTVDNLLEDWDDDLKTVRPGDVVSAAIEAHERYPNKRLIIHFMQPHIPHLGPTADEIRERIPLDGYERYRGTDKNITDESRVGVWDAVRAGAVSHTELDRLYTESLEIALDHVEDLLETVDGKTVVTGDHGELLGERILSISSRQYGHPHYVQAPELRLVPWLTVKTDNRREVESEEPIGFERINEDMVDERLVALGYKS